MFFLYLSFKLIGLEVLLDVWVLWKMHVSVKTNSARYLSIFSVRSILVNFLTWSILVTRAVVKGWFWCFLCDWILDGFRRPILWILNFMGVVNWILQSEMYSVSIKTSVGIWIELRYRGWKIYILKTIKGSFSSSKKSSRHFIKCSSWKVFHRRRFMNLRICFWKSEKLFLLKQK